MELGKKDKLRNLVSSKISDYQNELINNYFRLNNSKTENKFLDKIFIDYKILSSWIYNSKILGLTLYKN